MLRRSLPLLPILFLLTGFFSGHIALLTAAVCLLFIFWVIYAERWVPGFIWWPISVVACAMLALLHYLPGFIPMQLWPLQPPPLDAPPTRALWLSWDKALVGLTLLAWWMRRPKQPVISADLAALAFALTFFFVPLLSLITGIASWQPKWPEVFWFWLALNIGVVSLTEEAFYRGLIQGVLSQVMGPWAGIIIATVIYSGLHLLISPAYALVAGVSGLGYGLVLHFSNRLSLAVLLHASINTVHFLLLSYPLRLVAE